MTKNRLEAFSDGVLAIIITIMVLEMKIPHDASWQGLAGLLPVFLSYILSFLMLAIYWGNHHHLLHTVHHITGGILWANMHLLFWLSLVPFATGWMGENDFAPNTVTLYAILLDLCGIAYYILLVVIRKCNTGNVKLETLLKKQSEKGFISLAAYTIAIPVAFFNPLISGIIFILVAALWLIPDRNIERSLREHN